MTDKVDDLLDDHDGEDTEHYQELLDTYTVPFDWIRYSCIAVNILFGIFFCTSHRNHKKLAEKESNTYLVPLKSRAVLGTITGFHAVLGLIEVIVSCFPKPTKPYIVNYFLCFVVGVGLSIIALIGHIYYWMKIIFKNKKKGLYDTYKWMCCFEETSKKKQTKDRSDNIQYYNNLENINIYSHPLENKRIIKKKKKIK